MLRCNKGKKIETEEEDDEVIQYYVDRLQNDKGRKAPTETIVSTD